MIAARLVLIPVRASGQCAFCTWPQADNPGKQLRNLLMETGEGVSVRVGGWEEFVCVLGCEIRRRLQRGWC